MTPGLPRRPIEAATPAERSWPSAARAAAVLAGAACLALLAAGCRKSEPPAPPPGHNPAAVAAGRTDQYLAGPAQPVDFPVMPPAPKPTGPLPQRSGCITPQCHAAFATAPQIHSPVAQHACSACHADDTGGHHYPLRRGPISTCTFCHPVVGNAPHLHAAVEEGCAACHEPHAARTKYLLKADNVEQLCNSCHYLPLHKYAHGPFVKGECTLCHHPHEADNPMLLRGGEGPQHCYLCHEDIRHEVTTLPRVHDPAMKQCTSCHSPHSTDFGHQLKGSTQTVCLSCHAKVKKDLGLAIGHEPVRTGEQCTTCHAPHASFRPLLLRQRMDRLCLTCHDKTVRTPDGRTVANMKPVLLDSKYLHGPARDGNCSFCHNSHGSPYPALLTMAFPQAFYTDFDVRNYALCFGCHEQRIVLEERTRNLTSFRNGDVNLHYLHVHRDTKGRTCKTCHTSHGSNLPKHIASSVPFEGSSWSLPILFEKTPDGGRCEPGCHKPMSYSVNAPTSRPSPATKPAVASLK